MMCCVRLFAFSKISKVVRVVGQNRAVDTRSTNRPICLKRNLQL